MKKVPETFRCHVSVKGQQCPCDMTETNTYTYAVYTLDKRAGGSNKARVVDASRQAICPWHAEMFRRFRQDICRMSNVLPALMERVKLDKRAAKVNAMAASWEARRKSQTEARTPSLGLALSRAGVSAGAKSARQQSAR